MRSVEDHEEEDEIGEVVLLLSYGWFVWRGCNKQGGRGSDESIGSMERYLGSEVAAFSRQVDTASCSPLDCVVCGGCHLLFAGLLHRRLLYCHVRSGDIFAEPAHRVFVSTSRSRE